MLDRDKVNKKITNICTDHIDDKRWIQKTVADINRQTGLPLGVISDVLTLRVAAENLSDYEMALISRVLDKATFDKCYTDAEKKEWENKTYQVDKFTFPIRWKMFKVDDDQYIGVTSAKAILELKNANLINYDENKQRTLRRVEKGTTVYYQQDVDHRQVDAISESFGNDTYIPNTITLDIPEDTEWFYDDERNELVITSIDMFNIVDGYHRYLSMSNVSLKNKDWDYPMELRVVQFGTGKAQQFIYQEDQKHKMRKIDSDSLNQNSIATKIVNGLNSASDFELAGEINRNSGMINSPELVGIIDAIFVENKANLSRSDKKVIEIQTKNLLKKRINKIVNTDINVISNHWDYKYLVTAIFICSEESVSDDDLVPEINRLYTLIKRSEFSYLFKTKPFSKINYNRLKKIYRGEE